ncbi:MAG: NAD(+) synthase, partial [Longicatena sp.]
AELKENQFDPMKWFYHDYLVEHLGKDMEVVDFMRKYYHHELDEELGRWIQYYHLDEPEAFLKDLDWFLSTVERNSFKRLQTPPVLCLHKKSLATQIDAQMRYDKTMYEKWKENIRNM